MILAQRYLARYETPFAAYMALQRALLLHYMSRGGTAEKWCAKIAPLFQRRYLPVFSAASAPTPRGPQDFLRN
jgi:hypothetical protein